MTKSTAKKGNGTAVPIDPVELEKLGALQCTHREVAAWFGIARSYFEERLAKEPELMAAWERGIAHGKASLRRSQFRLAEKNAPMAMFLGMNYLEQRDLRSHEHSGKDGGPIEYTEARKRVIGLLDKLARAGAADEAAGKPN